MELFHFSDDPDIEVFVPRPVRVPSARAEGRAWLNGPLVWAIDRIHAFLYLFPRECPRILVWPTRHTSEEHRAAWFGGSEFRAIAHIEQAWLSRLRTSTIHRYTLPCDGFEPIGDVGQWVSRREVRPTAVERITDLPMRLAAAGVELRVMASLSPLKGVWSSSLHASGLRLRNAADWSSDSA